MSAIEFQEYFSTDIAFSTFIIFLFLVGGYLIGRVGEEIIRMKERANIEKWNKKINFENNYFEEFASIHNLREIIQVRDIGFCKDEFRSCDELYKRILKRQVYSIRIIRERDNSGVGYFALIGVRKKTYNDYIKGDIDDNDLLYKGRLPLIKSRRSYTNKYLFLFSISHNKMGKNMFGLEIFKRYISYIQEITIHARIKGLFLLVVNRGLNAIIKRKFSDLLFINLVKGKKIYYLPIENLTKVVFRINEISVQ